MTRGWGGIGARTSFEIVENEGILHAVTIFPAPYRRSIMQLPLTDPDTLFEELLQDPPPEAMQMA